MKKGAEFSVKLNHSQSDMTLLYMLLTNCDIQVLNVLHWHILI